MSAEKCIVSDSNRLGGSLAGIYSRVTIWYLLAVVILACIGIESIYRSVTPFYAMLYPAFASAYVPGIALLGMRLFYVLARRYLFEIPERSSLGVRLLWTAFAVAILAGLLFQARAQHVGIVSVLRGHWDLVRWHLLALTVFGVFFCGWFGTLRRMNWFDEEPSRRAAAWFVVGLVAFAFAFAGAIAMLRDGSHGIVQAYDRHGYEYISDIGVTSSIRALFHDYIKIHPYLSMHAKVHPPGPIALLWILSYGAGQDPMGLSLATMLLGALGIVPLYLWTADLTNRRVALTCCALYSLIPSVVLFTATSADITFTPFTLATLFLFWRAVHRGSTRYALAAGVGFALMSLLSFSLLGIGAFFAFVGVWRFLEAQWRWGVIRTAVLMLAAFLSVHLLVRWWSGFDIVACFHVCKQQFETDQAHLDLYTPRFPGWAFRFLNPACWFFFAGIPVSLLFLWRIMRPEPDTKALFLICALTLIVLDVLYLGRGEGERSALYIFPFVALPAAHLMHRIGEEARSAVPFAATAAFLAFQCWLVESYFYTYW